MASRKRKRLSVWGILARLGHTGDDHDEIVQHVFETASRVTLRSDDGEPMDGGDFLVGVFESLVGTTKDWPGCGSPEWNRLRTVALRRVVARLARDGLLDAIAVGPNATDVKDCEDDERASDGTEARDKDAAGEIETPATKCEGSASDGVDAKDGEPEVETPTTDDDSTDPRVGVQAYRAMIRRGNRNPTGWFRMMNRATPYRVIAGWASQNCPSVSREKLTALLDDLNMVRFWDDDGIIRGSEILRALESQLEDGCEHEQWMCVVSDFEAAIGRLRSVFERLSLL